MKSPYQGEGRQRASPESPRSLLQLEAEAVLAAAARLDEAAFAQAIELFATCQGKVLLTGAGTSGIIARKVAATMTSTGTAALFLHPNDALHGGLGAVSEGDVVVLVSNSGETAELLGLLPYLRSRHVPLVAIVGRLSSSIARAADVVLDAGAEHEICPFNLAPTSSTTVALALGDALAVSLYGRKGLTPEGFALNHPSGALGRRLTLRVRDVMHFGDALPAVTASAGWIDVLTTITEGGLGAAVVLDPEGVLVGLMTDGDVRRTLQRVDPSRVSALRARDVMTENPSTIAADVLLYDALQQMEQRPSQISVLPVVDDGRCVGLVRVHDLVRAGV